MAKGNDNMNHNQAELKELAKTLGRSLKRSGHEVPHTALLNALASGLNLRTWNTLKAVSAEETSSSATSKKASVEYSDATLFMARLVALQGKRLPAQDKDSVLRAKLIELLDNGQLSGMLKWAGWNMPADLDLKSCRVDAGDFEPEEKNARAKFVLTLGMHNFSWEVGYSKDLGWFLSTGGTEQAKKDLEKAMPDVTFAKPLPGESVMAKVVSDDHRAEAQFDIRPWLMQCSAADVANLLQEQFHCDYQTDAVVEWMGGAGKDEEAQRFFEYLNGAQQYVDDLGYSAFIDARATLSWLAQFAPAVFNKALCLWQNVNLVQAQEDEVRGRWDWIAGNDGCDVSFETEEEAAADAVQSLGLLGTALAEMPRFNFS